MAKQLIKEKISEDDLRLMDRWERYNYRAGTTGPILTIMHGGITNYGAYRYETDGFIYHGRRKKPVARWLRLERLNHGDAAALRPGRILDAHDIEKHRWNNLLRIKTKILPELRRRTEEVKKHCKALRRKNAWFNGWVGDQLIRMTYSKYDDCVRYEEVIRDRDRPALDAMARDYTSAEDDRIAKRFIVISDRLQKALRHNSWLSAMLLRSLDELLAPKQWIDAEEHRHGSLVEVTVNGRRYTTWLGPGGIFRQSADELTRVWPSPMNRVVSLDEPTLFLDGVARYEVFSSPNKKRHVVMKTAAIREH